MLHQTRRILHQIRNISHQTESTFGLPLHKIYLLKIINLLIITKSAESLKLLWFETWHTSFPWFYLFLPFYLIPQQILIFLYVSLCETNCIKIQTMSLVLNLFRGDSLCFIYFDVIICQRLEKKFKLIELFFQSREWSKKHVVLCNN